MSKQEKRRRVMEEIHQFKTWSQAFAACRAVRNPMTVEVPVNLVAEVARIYPSGRCEHVQYLRGEGKRIA